MLSSESRCPEHKLAPWEGSTRRKRLPRNWEALRRQVLRRDPICRICGIAPSTSPTKIGPTRAEKYGRSMFPDAESVTYRNRIGRGELLIVRAGKLIRITTR